MKAGVKEKSSGEYENLVKLCFGLAKPKVAVGIFQADGQADAGDGVRLIDVAIWNEFGTDQIPARSFLRAWFDENRDRARKTLMALMVDYLKNTRGEKTPDKMLERFGLWLQGEVQARIAKGIPPANAEATIAKKGSSTPLVDTEQLRSSITFAIDMGNGQFKVHKSAAAKKRNA